MPFVKYYNTIIKPGRDVSEFKEETTKSKALKVVYRTISILSINIQSF